MSISLDISARSELCPLAAQVRALQAVAGGRSLLLVGARARDLLLLHLPVIRATLDNDFVIAVESWEDYESVRGALIRVNGYAEVPGIHHRLKSPEGVFDLAPFGGIEDENRRIAWPPQGDTVMNLTGFRESLASAILVQLPESVEIPVVSLPALVMTKLFAWQEREPAERKRDATDIALILRSYLDAGHKDRLWTECADWLARDDFDSDTASAAARARSGAAFARHAGDFCCNP